MNTLLSQVLDYAVEAAALCSLFYGALLLAERRSGKLAIFILAFGLLVSVGHIFKDIWTPSFMSKQTALLHREQLPVREVPAGWGKDMSPEQRVRSIILARNAFTDHGKLIDYVDASGNRVRFAPTEEDIHGRDTLLILTAQFDDTLSCLAMLKFHWITIAIASLVLGYCFGRSALTRSVSTGTTAA